MRDVIASIEGEYRRYRGLGDGVIRQLADVDLTRRAGGDGNSIATLVAHLSGNFASRFSDFLASDGEKPWRKREEEFAVRAVTRDELLGEWNRGWEVLFGALAGLTDADLARTITIRGTPLSVTEALHRSLSHACYHVGQMVVIGRLCRGAEWSWLSIPPGRSDAYNQDPKFERAQAHAAELAAKTDDEPPAR
jgi:hypothetical protein